MKKFWVWILVAVFFLGFLVRLYKFDNPVADWHSFRQGDTNAVSQIYVNDGINLLYPRFFDISNVPSGIYDNPKGYRFVEFPIYNVAQVGVYDGLSWAGLNLAEAGRLVTILVSLAGAFFVYLITRKYVNPLAGLLAAVFYLFLPYSIYYGRVILPDPSTAMAITGGLYFFDKWLSQNKKDKLNLNINYWLAVLFTAAAFLLKPFALFFALPMLYLVWERFRFDFLKKWQLWVFLIITIAPLGLWRLWISQHPEGIPQSAWLFNGNGIRFRPSFFRWIFYERLTKLILGFVGVIFLIAGFVGIKKNKNTGFLFSIAASALIYLVVVATGNVQHDYYQILIIPALSIICGIGAEFLLARNKNIIWKSAVVVLILATFIAGWFGINKSGFGGGVDDYFNINDRGMVEAGNKANEILPKNAVVVALYDGSTTLLNITARPGWYSLQKDIAGLKKMGATHIVLANPTPNDFEGFGKMYPVVASSSSYLILKIK